MKIIDAHMHFSRIASFEQCARYESCVDYSASGYTEECERNNIAGSICMGLAETQPNAFPDSGAKTPMSADLTEKIPRGIYVCPGINPHTLDDESLRELELFIKNSKLAVGIKIYAGYYYYEVYDPVYDPVYRIAENYGIPVAIHSGATYSDRALLEYSHPLKIDRVAVAHRDLKIVICHMGAPWIFDACDIAYKNRNVYLDMSGILCGSAESIDIMAAKRLQIERYVQAIEFLDDYSRLLFGTDWPLAPMDAYINFCTKLVPENRLEDVFYNNAKFVYDRIV